MGSKIAESIRLLGRNFSLLAMLILTVWLPGNLVLNYIAFFAADPDDVVSVARASTWIEGIFGPIYVGAMIYALWHIKLGREVSYSEAIGAGLRNWGRLFVNRLVAGLIIVLGLIALIVPGVSLALRFALLDPVVVIEGRDSADARRRSTELTNGVKLQLLAVVVLLYLMFTAVTLAIYVPLGVLEEMAELPLLLVMGLEVLADCILDLVYSVLQIAVFLFYWEKREEEGVVEGPPSETPGDQEEMPQLGEFRDDGNPYQPPQV